MSEAGYVELPVIQWLSGHGSPTPGDKGLGWSYRGEAEMAAFDRPLEDPLVEKLLVEAILRINSNVTTPAQALLAVNALRKTMDAADKLTANRETLDRLRDGVKVELVPDEDAKTVYFIEFDPARQHLNDFTATNQYRVQGVKQCRDDTVLLVNGIPLVIAEYKSYLTSGKDWTEAVHQLHRYQRQAPLMLTPNVFCVAADEDALRYGTVLFHDANKEDIERHLDTWGPWLSQYPDKKGWWNEPEADNPDDPLEVPVKGLLRLKPCHVLDFLQHFVVFETKKGKTIKKVARYQQFEAVNDIVDRTLALIGKPASAQDRTGLVWHTQGSGKSLTMVFAAYKLRRQAALKNPTVMIVVDRRDLKTQISDDFDACDYPNVEKAMGVDDLKNKLRTVWRGTLVTTVQSFQKMGDLPPLQEDNIITLVDECHRSQKGNTAESYAMTMRVKLPNAFRFGLTGTPIDRAMINTHRDFGPVMDGEQERYLSYYGIKRAIKDGATLEVHYIRDKVPFIVDEKTLNVGFEQMCEEMELEDEEAKDLIQRQRSQWKELARHPDRVEIVVEKMLEHFLAYPDPSGFKAQLVGVDRTACARFKDALDAKLKARELPPEWSDVIISEGQNDDEDLARFHYGKQKQDDLIDYFKLTPKQWEESNREAFGEDRSKWRPPLKILIVCDRLLTGFDAPVEQVMYLDKPLRDHNLLQAIARTNRPLPAMDKRTGVVVDYFGVFANLPPAEAIRASTLQTILLDGQDVECRFVRSPTATKLRIKVRPDCLEVVVPDGRDTTEATEFVFANRAWVVEQLERARQLRAVRRPDKRMRGQILYRGEPVPVSVVQIDKWQAPNKVALKAGAIVITRGTDARTPVSRSLEYWLRRQARASIEQNLVDVGKRVKRTPNRVYVMGQRTKWGNCSALGNLSFNWRLIMAPDYVLRYIVTHEMVHLAIPDHSQRFWLTVHSLCPNADRARQWLVANGHRLTVDLADLMSGAS
jgi:type I restriction enzyme R subunit